MARAPTTREMGAFLVGHGMVDFVSGGKLSLIERNALWKVLSKLGPATVTTTGRIAGTTAMGIARAIPAVARGVKFVTMRHPYIAAAVVTYEVVKNREQIAQLLGEGWDIMQEGGAVMGQEFDRLMTEGPRPITGVLLPGARRGTRKKSSYNRAVSAGMKALKRSSKMGKRGSHSNSKRSFGLVSKTASRINKGLKVGTKGATGIVARAMRSILRKKK